MLSPNSTRFIPCGPIIIPEIIRPTIPGILNFLNTIGAISMIVMRIVNTITGSLKGRSGRFINNMLVLNLDCKCKPIE
jgi:hypothetical protein